MITKEQFVEWKMHPVTIEVYEEVKRAKQDLQDQLMQGVSIGQRADVTHGLTSRMIGQVEGLNQLLNLTYEDE